MASASERADIFGTFLETLREVETSQQEGDEKSLRVLRLLADSGAQPVSVLQEKADIPLLRLAEVLKDLQVAGFVTVKDMHGREIVEATEHGARVASVKITE